MIKWHRDISSVYYREGKFYASTPCSHINCNPYCKDLNGGLPHQQWAHGFIDGSRVPWTIFDSIFVTTIITSAIFILWIK